MTSQHYLVDSHCHLNYEGLVDREDEVLANAEAAGVGCLLTINTKLKEYDDVVGFADRHSHIYASVGVHPHEAEAEEDVTLDDLLVRAAHPRVVGIGETGLDYFYDNAPREKQKRSFRTHIAAGRETGLPVIIHTRSADDDTIALVGEEMGKGAFKGLIHCFTAGPALANAMLDHGFYISISGIVTFKKAVELQDVVKSLPLDRLLVETDSPFLAPVPYRGRTCEPAYVADTARFIADLKGVSYETVRDQTTENFFRLFDKAAPVHAAA